MRCSYIERYGVCLEPDGCFLQHRLMTTAARSFIPQMNSVSAPYHPNLKTDAKDFDPSLPFENYMETPSPLKMQLKALKDLGFDVELD